MGPAAAAAADQSPLQFALWFVLHSLLVAEFLAPNASCMRNVAPCSASVRPQVLWGIVTGERPQRGNLRAPRVPEDCPQEVAGLIQQCTAFDPTKRPTALALMQELGVLSRSVRNSLSIERSTSGLTSSNATQAGGPPQVARPAALSQGGSSQEEKDCVDYAR